MSTLIYNKRRQKLYLNVLGFVLAMPILVDFFSVIVQQMGLSNSSKITLMLYCISLATILFRILRVTKKRELIKDVSIYMLSLSPFLLNYIFFEETRKSIVSQEMLIVYFFYIFLAVFSIRRINSWELFFESLLKPGELAIALAVFILLFLDYEKYLVYMGFSYALLPFICNFYRTARCEKKQSKKRKCYAYFIAGLFSILSFGARTAIALVGVYIVVFELSRNDLSLSIKALSLSLLFIIVWIIGENLNEIAEFLIDFNAFKDSYLLKNLLTGRIFESKSRDVLYKSCFRRLSEMGLSISGFFGDRKYCVGFAYPHNIFLEILMSFGWILGTLLIIGYTGLIIKCLVQNKSVVREVSIFIIISMLARYLISGSYLTEGKFWIATALIVGLSGNKMVETNNA